MHGCSGNCDSSGHSNLYGFFPGVRALIGIDWLCFQSLYIFSLVLQMGVFCAVGGCFSTVHSAKSLLCDTLYYSVYSNICSNISCLRIEHYKQMLILQYSQSRAVCGILANL